MITNSAILVVGDHHVTPHGKIAIFATDSWRSRKEQNANTDDTVAVAAIGGRTKSVIVGR